MSNRGFGKAVRVLKDMIPNREELLKTLATVLTNISFTSRFEGLHYDDFSDSYVTYEVLEVRGEVSGISVIVVCDESLPYRVACAVWVHGYKKATYHVCGRSTAEVVEAIREVVSYYKLFRGEGE